MNFKSINQPYTPEADAVVVAKQQQCFEANILVYLRGLTLLRGVVWRLR
jgi:hypothetical protein